MYHLKLFRTTGIAEETIFFVAFIATSSLLLDTTDWSDKTAVKIVRVNPKIHTIDDFIYLESLLIFTSSDRFEIIENTVPIKSIGISIYDINLPIKVIENNIIGSIMLLDITFPVDALKVIRSGSSKLV